MVPDVEQAVQEFGDGVGGDHRRVGHDGGRRVGQVGHVSLGGAGSAVGGVEEFGSGDRGVDALPAQEAGGAGPDQGGACVDSGDAAVGGGGDEDTHVDDGNEVQ